MPAFARYCFTSRLYSAIIFSARKNAKNPFIVQYILHDIKYDITTLIALPLPHPVLMCL